MPLSVRTHDQVWKKRLEVKMGSAIQSRLPCAMAMKSDDRDISETSNSWKCSWRQKISDGCATVQVSSMPPGLTEPSRTGRERSFAPIIRLSCKSAIGPPRLFDLDPIESHQNNADRNARASTCRLRNTWPSHTYSWSSRLKVQTDSGSGGPCIPS